MFVPAILPQYHEKFKNMVTYYNQKDLVKFGEYLLSKERTNRITENTKEGDPVPLEERLKSVYHADIENWKHETGNKQAMDDLDHWCSYSGIDEENKKELLTIVSALTSLS